jgi:hypothetical protein
MSPAGVFAMPDDGTSNYRGNETKPFFHAKGKLHQRPEPFSLERKRERERERAT